MFAVPPPLRPGDLVHVVAPSGPFAPEQLWSGLAWLRTRYSLRVSPGILEREGFLAGTDGRRCAELRRAISDPEVRAVVVARGGYGAMRLVADLPWEVLRERPKWLVGFSDVTALHVMAWGAGVAAVHGANVTGLGLDAQPTVRATWLASLERPGATRTWTGLRSLRAGRATGPIVGGNLTLLCAMAAAGLLKMPRGAILAVEDVNEAPYRVDRMLTSLRLGGYLDAAAAVIFGGFDHAPPGLDGWSVEDVIGRLAGTLRVPVVAGAPFGHRAQNEAFVLGRPATVDADAGVVSLGAGAGGCSA